MASKTIILVALLFTLIVVGMFVFAYLERSEQSEQFIKEQQ